MQRLLREIFCIAYVITFTLIYGNLIVLLMKKIAKTQEEKSVLPPPIQLQKNTSSLINLKIHYPTMLILFADDNANLNFDI